MATGTAMTPAKAPQPSPAPGTLTGWYNPGSVTWNLYDNASAARLAAATQVQAPPAVRSPLPLEEDSDDVADATESKVHVRIHNMPKDARILASATGAALKVDTGRGVPIHVGGARAGVGSSGDPAQEIEQKDQPQNPPSIQQSPDAISNAGSSPQAPLPAASPMRSNYPAAGNAAADSPGYHEASPTVGRRRGNTSSLRVKHTGNISSITFTPTAFSNGIPTAGTLTTYLLNPQTNAKYLGSVRNVSGAEGQVLGYLYDLSHAAPGLAEQSPTLMKEMVDFVQDKGSFEIYDDGHGNQTDPVQKKVQIDSSLIGKNPATNDPNLVIGTVAHEFGHYAFKALERSTEDAYIQSNKLSEGAATINNLKVSDEIYQASGEEVYVLGTNAQDYGNMYGDYLSGPQTIENLQAAEQKIGEEYAYHEKPTTEHLNLTGRNIRYIDVWKWDFTHPDQR
jgi:hypothetical protein